MKPTSELAELVALVRRLRAPDGCPWDREQSLASVRPYLLEEAHELADALDEGRWPEIREELGDLLFQGAFIACLAEEADAFTVGDAIDAVERKMIDRHPHVFGNEKLVDREAVERAWERRKLDRRQDGGLLAGVPRSLPALNGAYRLTQKAAGVGFDWATPAEVLDKIDEEVGELREALASGLGQAAAAEEIGDLFFALANLARKLEIDPEAAAAACNRKFVRRFRYIERGLQERGRPLAEASLDEMEALWQEAKASEAGENSA
ncbi:MAG: nucleoside triphosphate pyrophosphohydrolase [Acidobacteriota bacterium]